MEQGLVTSAQMISSLEILLTSLKGLARKASKSGKTHIWTSKIGDTLTSIVIKPVQPNRPGLLSLLQNRAYHKNVSTIPHIPVPVYMIVYTVCTSHS